MTEQLYRWVKASERVWEYGKETIVKHSGVVRTVKYHNVIESLGAENVQWLEPYTPSLNAGGLEIIAGEIKARLDKFGYRLHEDALPIIESVLAGAAYSKGGEEIAERYAVELAQWILHRFHSTEYDKDILKWKWNQTLWSSQEMFERFMEEEYPDFVIPGASRPSLDIDKVVDGLKEILKLSKYDSNHDNMLYNIQEINKLVRELLNTKHDIQG